MLVPLYTRVLVPAEYGTVILMYSFVAVVFIVLTYGMETAFFRYSELESDKRKVYSSGVFSLLITTAVFICLVFFFPTEIASWIKYPGYKNYIIYLGLILSLDVLSALPFAKLRAENKPRTFASIKIINIAVNIGFNLYFILLCPYILKHYDSGFIYKLASFSFDAETGLITYIFISNLIASAITFILLSPEILKLKLSIDPSVWRKLVYYGFPLLFAGLAGVMNETLGRILIRYMLPETIAESQLGIYSASYKIAILMALFIQAFRYAAEPFFFAYARKQDSREVYAQIMNYFVIVVAILFLIIMLYLDIVILILGEGFRMARDVIPILLFAYIFLGIYYNLSVWFKLTNKTRFGAYMALIGALITIVFNVWWIPRIGYMGSAWATFLCYAAMMLISFLLMRKYYPVNYNTIKIAGYLIFALLLYLLSEVLNIQHQGIKLGINTILLFMYLAFIGMIERKNLRSLFAKT